MPDRCFRFHPLYRRPQRLLAASRSAGSCEERLAARLDLVGAQILDSPIHEPVMS
jgi:hypothetical protein